MDQDFLQLLQKYNMHSDQKTLLEHLNEPNRFQNFSKTAGDLLLDFSRVGLDELTLSQMLKLATHSGVEEARDRLFAGDEINFTEQRPALHMALRSDEVLEQLDTDTVAKVKETREKMNAFARSFAAGHLPGDASKKVKHIVHIGIGGSFLGPRLLTEALGKSKTLQVHFLASVDAHLRTSLLEDLDPHETAVVVVTKSFSTGETLLHARRLRSWLEASMSG